MSNKKNKDKNKFLSIFAVVVSLILVATLLDSIGAQNISRDINLGIRSDITDQYPFYVNHRKSYTSGNERWLHGHIGGSMRPEISNHTIAVNYYARIQNSATGQNISNGETLVTGTPLSFSLKDFEDIDIAWNGTGQSVDTPYGRWVETDRAPNSNERCQAYDYAGKFGGWDFHVPLLVVEPDYSIEHEGTAQLDCTDDGFNCSVVSPGTIDSKIVINQTTGKFYFQIDRKWSCSYVNSPMRTKNRESVFVHQVPQQTINFNFDVVGGSNIEPPVVSGPDEIFVGEQAEYTIVGEHPEDKDIQFGTYYDGVSGGFTPYGTPDPELTQTVTKEYNSQGIKEFKAKTKDIDGSYSLFSNIAQTTVRPLPDVSLFLDKDEIVYGESTTLTWDADYADTCWSDDFETNNNTSGSIEVSPNSSKVYEVTCDSPYDASVEVSEQDTLDIVPTECKSLSISNNGSIPNNTAGLCETGVLTDGPNESTGEWEWRCGNAQCSASCPDGQIVDPNNGGQCVDGATNVVVDVTDWEFNPRIVGEADDTCTATWDTSQFSHPDETTCKIVSNTGDEIPVDTLSGEHSSDILPGNSYRMSCRFVDGVTDVSSESEEQSCVLNPDFSEF